MGMVQWWEGDSVYEVYCLVNGEYQKVEMEEF